MFDDVLCFRCGGYQPRGYPYSHCWTCLARIRQETTRLCFIRAFSDQVWEILQQNIWNFIWTETPFRKHCQRLHYLRCAVLATGSPFKRFTRFSGGIEASISSKEDIVDIILSFLVVDFFMAGWGI